MKNQTEVPNFMKKMSITSIFKCKGSKNDLTNDRGLFGLSKIRSILDKVIYNDIYEKIDNNLSFSNVGGRKNRNIRDHLFVIYGILNDVFNGKAKPVDFEAVDVIKCFDEMNYQETHNDLWDVSVSDNRFALISAK